MRSPLVSVLLGLSLVTACTVGDPIDGGGGGGGGGGGDVDAGVTLMPRVTADVDRATIDTELGKTETLRLTLNSVDGFSGDVAILPGLVNAQDQPLSFATVEGPTSLSLAADGSTTADYTISVPSNASGSDISAMLKLDVTSAVGASTVFSTLTVSAVYTVAYAAGTGTDTNAHPGTAQNVRLKRGALVRFRNLDTIQHRTHGDGPFPHEGVNGGQPNGTYEVQTVGIQPGTTDLMGCHTHPGQNNITYGRFTIE